MDILTPKQQKTENKHPQVPKQSPLCLHPRIYFHVEGEWNKMVTKWRAESFKEGLTTQLPASPLSRTHSACQATRLFRLVGSLRVDFVRATGGGL